MRSIAICGSKKYKDEIKQFNNQLEKLGILTFPPTLDEPITEDTIIHSNYVTNVIFKGLTLEHFDWIKKADVCFIFNKNGYIGKSVTLELGYAVALGKIIIALEKETGDPCSNALIDKLAKTPKELILFLK